MINNRANVIRSDIVRDVVLVSIVSLSLRANWQSLPYKTTTRSSLLG